MMKKPVTVTPTKSGSVLYLAAAWPGHSVHTCPCPVTWRQLGQMIQGSQWLKQCLHRMVSVIQNGRVYSDADSGIGCSQHV